MTVELLEPPLAPPLAVPMVETAHMSTTMPATSASEMKKQGWRSVMATVRREGRLLITNHNTPEAVILPPEQYDKLVSAAQKGVSAPDPHLEALRLRFRDRMQGLLQAGANARLGEVMNQPVQLEGQVIAGAAY